MYKAAVGMEMGKPGSHVDRVESNLGELLGVVIANIEKNKADGEQHLIVLSDCATVVRCILAAWAFTVPLIEVKQAAGNNPLGETRNVSETMSVRRKIPNEIVLGNLPPVSAFY